MQESTPSSRSSIKLDQWQEEVMNYKGDFILCTGRRVGKTYILARKAIDRMARIKGTNVIIVSLTEDQAMIIMSMALNYAQEQHKYLLGKGKKKPTLRSLHLNGGKMLVRPVGNTGDGVRGFEGGVLVVDEASRMPPMFWIAAKPILLTTGGEIWMGSTPFGKQGYFWEKFDETINKKIDNPRFKVFYISSEDAMRNRKISHSWTKEQKQGALRILKEDKEEMSDLEYGQEYLGLFLEDLQRYFSDEIIDKCCILERRNYKAEDRDYYLGVDLARMGEDASTFELVEKMEDDSIEHIENIVTKKTLTTQSEDKIHELNRSYNTIKKIFIDAGSGSLGVGILDHLLLHPETKRKVEALNNRARSLSNEEKDTIRILKLDLYDNLRALMERGMIKLLNDDNVKASLRSVIYSYAKTQVGLTQMKIFGADTHIAEGLIRAAHCFKDKTLKLWVR